MLFNRILKLMARSDDRSRQSTLNGRIAVLARRRKRAKDRRSRPLSEPMFT